MLDDEYLETAAENDDERMTAPLLKRLVEDDGDSNGFYLVEKKGCRIVRTNREDNKRIAAER